MDSREIRSYPEGEEGEEAREEKQTAEAPRGEPLQSFMMAFTLVHRQASGGSSHTHA